PHPSWGEEAAAIRSATVASVRETVDALQRAGVSAQGEVMDGAAPAAVRDAVGIFRPDLVLLGDYPGEDQDALRRAARGADVEGLAPEPAAGAAPA
ncbi:MAG TPA: hypothetical protein VKD47_00230, partial [Miltoncostaeaceae bacterium]|nr:hypothetical protein [Miltoncostaeaceae bacterium]